MIITHRYENMDFAAHNREVAAVWDAYFQGAPVRIPMVTGISDRYFVLNRETNPKKVSFYDYSRDKSLMFDLQCDFARWRRYNIIGDHDMGPPEEGYAISIDFQNYYEAAWLGCEVKYPNGAVPYAVPWLREDNKHALFHHGLPDPFSGFMATAKEYYDYFTERAQKTQIDGIPVVHIGAPFTGLDGMFTVACELRGPDNLCMDMLEDPDYYHSLMRYLTEATIARTRAWRRYMGMPEMDDSFGFADDSIALLSVDMYKAFVLPYHKQLAEGLSTMRERGFAHLCGDATRHFETIRDELNVYTFDTGFPVDHRKLCLQLGREVAVQGGPSVGFITQASCEDIMTESERIINSVKDIAPRFVFRDGNDLPPGTPLEKIEALYSACKRFGVL